MPPTPTSPSEQASETPWNSTMSVHDILSTLLQDNSTSTTATSLSDEDRRIKKLHEFQIIKAVVLAAVTAIIMFSVCKMVFQLFVRYSGKQDDR